MELFWQEENGNPFITIEKLRKWLADKGRKLVFATNAGIYATGYIPLGLHMEKGEIHSALNIQQGKGNFYLEPNGVFSINSKTGASIVESTRFQDYSNTLIATQSCTILLENGLISKQFNPYSPNRRIRSGVGVINNADVVFAISEEEVTFHEFALLFKEKFACRDALFLDGVIAKIHEDTGGNFAGLFAVTADIQ